MTIGFVPRMGMSFKPGERVIPNWYEEMWDFGAPGAYPDSSTGAQIIDQDGDTAPWKLTDDVNATIAQGTDEEHGSLVLTTGSNADDFASIQRTSNDCIIRPWRNMLYEVRFKIADADDTQWLVGIATEDATGTTKGPLLDGVTDGIYFSQETDTGQDIYFRTEDNTTLKSTDTGVDVADDTYVTCQFYLTGHDRRVQAFVNGNLVATHTDLQLPDNGDAMALSVEVHSPTASSAIEIDYIYYGHTRYRNP